MPLTRDPLRRTLLVVGALVVVVAAGLAIGLATSGDDPDPSSTGATTTASASAGTTDARSAAAMTALVRPAGSWPGSTGLSGVNGGSELDTAGVTSFCTSRGRACNVAMTYTDRTSWTSMTSGTAWTFENFADFDGVLVVSQGLVPTGGKAELTACANGDHNSDWQAFGTLMKNQDRADSIIRLGWEFNESTSSWRADDTSTWIKCYQQAADNIRATNPDVILDWTINAHDTPDGVCGGLSTTCYPGDDYVDIVGIDNYDHYPASTSESEFTATAAQEEGLTWLYDFALTHGKPFSVGEWGVTSTDDGGGDNPDFVTWMHSWFAEHAENLAYETYFTDCESSGIQSSLYDTASGCSANTKSAQRYTSLYGG